MTFIPKKTKRVATCLCAVVLLAMFFADLHHDLRERVMVLPDGTELMYAGVTIGEPRRPGPGGLSLFEHSLSEPLPWQWRLAGRLPAAAKKYLRFPSRKTLANCVSSSDQVIWFTLPDVADDYRLVFSFEDERGFESQVESTKVRRRYGGDGDVASIPGVGPRRGSTLRLLVRDRCDFKHDKPLPAALASVSLGNPLKPQGPSLPETDRLPSTKTVGDYAITLHRLVRSPDTSGWTSGMLIEWSIAKHGKSINEWRLGSGSFEDGSGNRCSIDVFDAPESARCRGALFSDDPVWKVRLKFHRSDDNRSDYDPIFKLADLPVPREGETIKLNRTVEVPPWRLDLLEASGGYNPAHQRDLLILTAKFTPTATPPIPRVLRSDPHYLSDWTRSDGAMAWYFDRSSATQPWKMEVGLDFPIEVEFQSRVEFRQ